MKIKTKRFAYKLLLDYYDRMEDEVRNKKFGITAYEYGCTTILGVRRVGKTILMKQLAESKKEVSEYFDCTDISEDFDFESFYEDLENRGIERLYLDEVCKIPDEIMADFIGNTKLYSAQMLITITGSEKGVVSKISSRIGRGRTISLPPIMYIEKLAWSQDEEVDDYLNYDFKNVSTYEKLINYLKTQNVVSEESSLENTLLVRMSYLYRFVNKYRSDNDMEIDLAYVIEESLSRYSLSSLKVKNIESSNIDRTHIERYNRIKDYLSLKDLCISCNDVESSYINNCQFYRGDLIIVALELEYCTKCKLNLGGGFSKIFCGETISELMKKYNIE